MKWIAALIVCMCAFGGTAFASELDREEGVANASRQLEGTTVLRVDANTGKVAMLRTKKEARDEVQAQELAHKGRFAPVSDEHHRSELDSDAGSSSWYFCYYPRRGYYDYSYQSYYYYGSYYSPYYQYSYGGYNYYYYGSRRW